MNRKLQSIKDKLRVIAKEKNIEFNQVMRFYMYDRFIVRLANSNYKDNFILKGGYLLGILFGVDNRSTMDIDTAITNELFSLDNIIKMVTEIISIDTDDEVLFKLNNIGTIREEDEYGGFRITLEFYLGNYKDKFHLDIATGDPIYPWPNDYSYKSLLSNEEYNIRTYSIETILAEKIETIFSKLESSSRMKDYYDIYLLYKNEYSKINIYNFKKAVSKTFDRRDFKCNFLEVLSILKNSEKLKTYWTYYSRKNNFSKDITYEETILCLEKFVDLLLR